MTGSSGDFGTGSAAITRGDDGGAVEARAATIGEGGMVGDTSRSATWGNGSAEAAAEGARLPSRPAQKRHMHNNQCMASRAQPQGIRNSDSSRMCALLAAQ